jgi:hypothetical protein
MRQGHERQPAVQSLSGRVRRFSPVRALVLPFVACAAIALAHAGGSDSNDHRGRGHHDNPYAIGLWGDLPYSAVQAEGVLNLIDDMNAQRLAFTVHDGDLKSGGSECTDSSYMAALDFFDALDAAAMFTPGDNDWTDCDRNPAYNSLVQLDKERELFFRTPFSLGRHPMRQQVQTDPLCLNADGALVGCVENRRWTVGRVTYATLNVQGSCNNLCDTAPDPVEYAARNAANIQWLKETFAQAEVRGSAVVMLISQASSGWDVADPTRAPLRDAKTLAQTDGAPDGFQEFLTALREEVTAFRKPVAYVHGDSHYFRIDKPLLDAAGRRLENFTRVETFGDNQANGTNDVQWLKVSVDPSSREVFAYQPQIVPANRVAVPAP